MYARASGMGFAHTAVVEDASSLLINPAGLAQVRRLEFSGGLLYNHLSQDVAFNTNYGGFSGTGTASNTSTVSAAQLSHLTLAYPFPTYRGSLVLGVGYQRVASLKSDYFRAGFLTPQAGSIDGLVERVVQRIGR
jgi:long-subunit fatty acid transport protein